ncbi:MAG: COX15/CtaA family protein [Burkholderiales bacterium]|nr:COX15/CtaA family protein [Burkholderiales bacterium]
MIHRYLAMAVGVLIIALTVIEWWRWLHPKCISAFSHVVSAWRNSLHSMMNRLCSLSAALVMALRSLLLSIWIGLPSAPWYLAFLLAFVCLQGAFGAWTVTMKLQPVIVTTHLLLGMGLLGLLAWLAARQTNRPSIQSAAVALRIPAVLALIVLAIQIALGGWVSTNYAALACTEFPLCQGAWLPSMDFSNGFTLWRHLGKTGSGDYLPFPALVAIHWIHRLFAFAVIGLVGIVAHRALKIAELHKIARGLLIMLAVQFITGVSTVFFDWPLALAVAHNGGAALLVLLLTMLNYRISSTANNRVESRDTTLSTA